LFIQIPSLFLRQNLIGIFLAAVMMKNKKMRYFLLIMVFCLGMVSLRAQDNTNAIITALKTANADEVGKRFDNFIDLKLPDKDEIKNMGKNQASIALQSFFRDNGIKGFELTGQRETNGAGYLTGKLQNNGKGFNISILLKNKDGQPQIITLRISNT
jgi:hypothetical protein